MMKTLLSVVIILIIIALFSCNKLDFQKINKVTVPTINKSNTIITVQSKIIDISKEGIEQYGHCWNTLPEPTINNFFTSNKETAQKESYTDTLYSLLPDKQYFIRPYIISNSEVIYGTEESFFTPDSGIFLLCQSEILSASEVKLSNSISQVGSLIISEYGSEFYDSYGVGTSTKYQNLVKDYMFSDNFSNLEIGKRYFARAYGKLSESVTIKSNIVNIVMPILKVKTISYTVTGSTSAILSGEIEQLGFNQVSDYGFCWSATTSTPDFNSNLISKGSASQVTEYQTSITNLLSGQKYYFRAYAVENNAVYYGETLSFTVN